MKVTHLIHDLRRGGAEHLLVDLARVAPGAGMDISVVSMMPVAGHGFAEQLVEQGVAVRSLQLASRWDPRGPRRAVRVLGELAPDVIHSHLKHADLLAAHAAPRLGVPMVSTLHLVEDDVGVGGRLKRWLAHRARSRRAALTIAVSDATRDWYLSTFGADPARVVTIRNGVPAPAPVDEGEIEAVRRDLGVPADVTMFTTVAILRPGKGHDDLLQAVAGLPERAGLHFVVAGDGPERLRLEERAGTLGVGDAVSFVGFRGDVDRLLAASDAVIHPTRADALPTALIHALAAGIPSIATRVGGVPEIVTDEVGVLVPVADPGALSSAITRLAADPDHRRWLGKQARERFDRHFDGRVWAAALCDAYRTSLLQVPRR